MDVRINETVTLDFVTQDPSTGAATDADSTPSVSVFEETSDTAIITPTPTKRSGRTGHYRVDIAVTAANGFEVDKEYSVAVDATVSTTAGTAVIAVLVPRTAPATASDVTSGLAGLNDISVADILAGTVEGTITVVQAMRLLVAWLGGEASYTDNGDGTYTLAFRDQADTKDRITLEISTTKGDRSSTTLDGS